MTIAIDWAIKLKTRTTIPVSHVSDFVFMLERQPTPVGYISDSVFVVERKPMPFSHAKEFYVHGREKAYACWSCK